MNLILHSLNDISDPTWSVIILLCCGLLFTSYCIAYILILAFQEMQDDGQTQEQEGEVCQRQTE